MQILFLTLLLLLNSGCSDQNEDKDEVYNFSSIQFNNELIMFQTDDKYGEWGGNTYFLKMYRDSNSEQLMIDYTEYQGKAGPPDPPEPNSKEKIYWFTGQPILFESYRLIATKELKAIISSSIQELIAARINNDEFVSMSGVVNHVMYTDSTIIIQDYPSIKWNKFQETINKIKNE